MLPNDVSYWIRQERNKDLLEEARRERLARLAARGRLRHGRLHGRAIIWLGRRLIALGSHLQQRYGTVGEAPALGVANRS